MKVLLLIFLIALSSCTPSKKVGDVELVCIQTAISFYLPYIVQKDQGVRLNKSVFTPKVDDKMVELFRVLNKASRKANLNDRRESVLDVMQKMSSVLRSDATDFMRECDEVVGKFISECGKFEDDLIKAGQCVATYQDKLIPLQRFNNFK